MAFDQKFIEAVKAANRIEDIVAEYTTLKSAYGKKTLKGKCIFHEDKDPSLTVYPEKQIFRCYGCDAGTDGGSDVIAFVRKADKLSFTEAVEKLAKRAGIPISQDDAFTKFNQRQSNRMAVYRQALNQKPEAKAYLYQRGLTEQTIQEYGVGYCPINTPEDRLMSGRITFPIHNSSGHVVGMAGRKLNDDIPGEKYVNDANSAFFKKGELLFGINMARKSIQELDKVYLVEGYMDQILFSQMGVKNTAALMCTSITDAQLKLIKRYTKNIVLVLDGDKAGQEATLRRIDELRKEDVNVVIVPIPDGHDPDDVALLMGNEENLRDWLTINSRPADFYQVETVVRQIASDIQELQEKALNDLMPVLTSTSSPQRLEKLVSIIAAYLGMSCDCVYGEIKLYKESHHEPQ